MPTTFANTINGNEILAKRAERDYAGNDLQTTYATKTEVSTGLASKEDSANKSQTLDPSSSTDFPSSAATANYVNSSVATATANFLGNFTLAELGLTYPATDAQIGAALDAHTWPAGVTPTNNDYTYIEIENPQTTGIDDSVERFKFNGTNWVYEYTLNNSTFTSAEKAAIDSGIDSAKVAVYDAHVADTDIHVTLSDKSTWNAKQDAISDLATIRSGAALGSTAVQPGDLATVATSGDYADLTNKPTVPTTDQQYNPNSTNPQSGTAVAEAIAGTGQVPTVTSSDNDKVLTATYSGGVGSFAWQTPSTTQVQADWTEADSTDPSYIQNKPSIPSATSDLTNDSGFITLSDVPAQVNADWNSSSGASEILNKPTIPSGAQLVPTATSADADKVLTVDSQGTPAWASAQAPISAGDGIAITNNVVSAKVDGTTIDTNASGELTVVGGGGGSNLVVLDDNNIASTYSTIADMEADIALGKIIVIRRVTSDFTQYYTYVGKDNGLHRFIQVVYKNEDGGVDSCNLFWGYVNSNMSFSYDNHSVGLHTRDWLSSNGSPLTKYVPIGEHTLNEYILVTYNKFAPAFYKCILAYTESSSITRPDLDATHWVRTYLVDMLNDLQSQGGGGTQADWAQTDSSAVDYIKNKPVIPTKTSDLANDSGYITSADLPTVDQTYDASSTHAQSGTAVAQAVATKEDVFDVGTGLEMDTSGSTPTLQVEAPVDIVAGPGIVIDNPDGNTLRVSVAQADENYEKELYVNTTVPYTDVNDVFTLSEPVTNFERIRVESWNREFQQYRATYEFTIAGSTTSTVFVMCMDHSISTSNIQRLNMLFSYNSAGNLVDKGHILFFGNGSSSANGVQRGLGIHRIVGIHRIAGGN